jgi:hypothetical protein
MPRTKKGSIPVYGHHKARQCAVVTIDGHDYYLGPFGSPSSKQKYAALIRAWQDRQDNPEANAATSVEPSVNELILVYLKHVEGYYKLNHGKNKEAGCVDDALKVLQECG